MDKEIGGYLELEQLQGKEFYSDIVALNNGCNALLYVLMARKVKKLYIPYFLCSCVSELCERYSYEYEYYEIANDFFPKFDKKLSGEEYLYVVNFYGQLRNQDIKRLKDKYRNVIVDNVQAFFQRPIEHVDTIYSCRKFFGVPDGGYLATDTEIGRELNIDMSRERMNHILGRFEGSATEYYDSYRENEEACKTWELRYMSKLTRNILSAIDYERVKEIREENYKILHEELGKINGMKFIMGEGPFCYPFYCEDGDLVRAELIKNKIYVPTLWPNVLKNAPILERDFAVNILPLPCDQRYREEDMKYIVEVIKDTLK